MGSVNSSVEAHDLERIEREAIEWLLAHNACKGDVANDDADSFAGSDEAFLDWLDANPKHGEIYAGLNLVYADLGKAGEGFALPAPPDIPNWRLVARSILKPRFLVPLSAAACVAVMAPIVIAPGDPQSGADPTAATQDGQFAAREFDTAISQHRELVLADGSVVTLGAASQVRVKYIGGERRVELLEGEAFFDVAKDTERPFFVEAGLAEVRVVGTRFEVDRQDGSLSVTVMEGEVEVNSHDNANRMVRALLPGQKLELAEGPAKGATRPQVNLPFSARVRDVGVLAEADWVTGWLSYEDAPLSQVVADINRYYGPGVKLADPATGNLHVTAAFPTQRVRGFLEAMDETIPVYVTRGDDGSYLIHRDQ